MPQEVRMNINAQILRPWNFLSRTGLPNFSLQPFYPTILSNDLKVKFSIFNLRHKIGSLIAAFLDSSSLFWLQQNAKGIKANLKNRQ